jgi:sulfide dehydrogenase cytochrome subunit
MDRLVGAYSRAELEVMADYFSRQSYRFPKQETEWPLIERGRRLHRRYCIECHGDPDHLPDDGVPLLHGHWMDYLRWTLRDYLVGINQGDEEMNRRLAALLRNHGPHGLEALINYYGKARP